MVPSCQMQRHQHRMCILCALDHYPVLLTFQMGSRMYCGMISSRPCADMLRLADTQEAILSKIAIYFKTSAVSSMVCAYDQCVWARVKNPNMYSYLTSRDLQCLQQMCLSSFSSIGITELLALLAKLPERIFKHLGLDLPVCTKFCWAWILASNIFLSGSYMPALQRMACFPCHLYHLVFITHPEMCLYLNMRYKLPL